MRADQYRGAGQLGRSARYIPFARPDLTEKEVSAVVEVLRSGWLTTGPKAALFEERFARAVDAPYAVALSSCTGALHLALEALGVGDGDEVILPTMTFAATAEVVLHVGARPVLADISAADHTLAPTAAESLVTSRTKAILTVDFGGQAPDLDPLLDLCDRLGLVSVDDAAHAFPATYRGRRIGSLCDVTCFSFYATKSITTGEGGMATTAREDLAQRIRLLSLHGISRDAWSQQAGSDYEILHPGWKYNLSDLAAALGLAQLERADEMWHRRQKIAQRYQQAFASVDYVETLTVRRECEPAWHLFVLKLKPEVLRIGRDRFAQELHKREVGTSVHFIPLHLHPYYRESLGHRPDDFPVALDCYRRSISLPIFSSMTDDEVERVIEAFVDTAETYRR